MAIGTEISMGVNARVLRLIAGFALAAVGCSGGGSDESDGGDGGDDGATQSQCGDQAVTVGAAPLRRLTKAEYENTIRDLLGTTAGVTAAFVPDEDNAGFEANMGSAPSALQVQNYVEAAEALAAATVADGLDGWISCDHADTACAEGFLSDFGRRAFRRPVTAEELAGLSAVYTDARDLWGADKGIELAIAVILASPEFLYLVELGGEPSPGEPAVALTPYELASRLSYFVWSSMPDEALLAAAESGALDTREGIEAEVRRMMIDDRANETIASFHRQWMGLDDMELLVKDPATFPEWTPELGLAMRDETYAFATHVFRSGGGKLQTLLSGSYSFVSDALAPLYGVPTTGEPGFRRVELDAGVRSGILTHPSFLASHSHASENSWVARGRFVRSKLLCQTMPPPPPGVDMTVNNNPDRTEDPACSSCHQLMDPIGQGFDAYDPLGRYAPFDEAGQPIDQSGEIFGTGDVTGPFAGPVELAAMLSSSEEVGQCMATQWFRFATRREPAAEDDCSVTTFQAAFEDSEQNIPELVVAIATSDSFRYRPAFSN